MSGAKGDIRRTTANKAVMEKAATNMPTDQHIKDLLDKLDAANVQLHEMIAQYNDDRETVATLREIECAVATLRVWAENIDRVVMDSTRSDSLVSRIMSLEKGLAAIKARCEGCGAMEEIDDLETSLEDLRSHFERHRELFQDRQVEALQTHQHVEEMLQKQKDRKTFWTFVIRGVVIALAIALATWLVPQLMAAIFKAMQQAASNVVGS